MAGVCELAEATESGTSADGTTTMMTGSTSGTGVADEATWTSDGTTSSATETADTTSGGTSGTSSSTGGSTTCADGCTTTDDSSAVDEDSTTGTDLPPENIVTNGGFEDGVFPPLWHLFGTSAIDLVQDPVFEGSYAANVTSRDAEWNGIAAMITNEIVPGGVYGIAAQIMLDSETVDTVAIKMSWKLACYGQTEQYVQVSTLPARNDAWRRFEGTITIPANCEPSEVLIYFEGGISGTAFLDYFIDDFSLWVVSEPEPDPTGEETGTEMETDTDTDTVAGSESGSGSEG